MIINKVFDFIEANINMLGERYGHLSAHKKEQVLYRMEACKDTCTPKGKCEECGCAVPGKLFATRSCNKGKKFPDLMSMEQWEMYKKTNKIEIKNVQ